MNVMNSVQEIQALRQHSDPYLLGMAFANAARALGARFYRNTEIIEIIRNDQIVSGVRLREGIHKADITVLAAGAWSIRLASDIDVRLPMAPVRSMNRN